jgi:hypothetical protein
VEGQVRTARQRDAERLPIQATVEQPEIRCVNIDEHPAGVQHGKVEWQALNAGSGQSKLVSGAGCSRVDGSAAVNRDQDAAISIAIGCGERGRFVHFNRSNHDHCWLMVLTEGNTNAEFVLLASNM